MKSVRKFLQEVAEYKLKVAEALASYGKKGRTK